MKVLIAYATYSSGTDLATQLVEKLLSEKEMSVERKDIRTVSEDELGNYNAVIFASPSWRTKIGDGSPHEFFLAFMEKMQDKKVEGQRFAILGLGDTAYTHFTGAVDHLEKFVISLGGTLLLPSLRIDGFYFDQHNNEQKIIDWTNKLRETL